MNRALSKRPVIRWSTLSLMLCGCLPEILHSLIFEFVFHKQSTAKQWSCSRSLESWLMCLPGSHLLPRPAPWPHSVLTLCSTCCHPAPQGRRGCTGGGGRAHMPRHHGGLFLPILAALGPFSGQFFQSKPLSTLIRVPSVYGQGSQSSRGSPLARGGWGRRLWKQETPGSTSLPSSQSSTRQSSPDACEGLYSPHKYPGAQKTQHEIAN